MRIALAFLGVLAAACGSAGPSYKIEDPLEACRPEAAATGKDLAACMSTWNRRPTTGAEKLDAAGGLDGALLGKPPPSACKPVLGPNLCNLAAGTKIGGFDTRGATFVLENGRAKAVMGHYEPAECPRIIATFDKAYGAGRRVGHGQTVERIHWVGRRVSLGITQTANECHLSVGDPG